MRHRRIFVANSNALVAQRIREVILADERCRGALAALSSQPQDIAETEA